MKADSQPNLTVNRDAATLPELASLPTGRPWRNLSRVLVMSWLACCLTGCSLFVMAGKMFFGDPLITSQFQQRTGVNLEKEQKRVLVLCSTPYTVTDASSSLHMDILGGVSRRLRVQGIEVVNPDEVLGWLDDRGGSFDKEDPTDVANEFDADYVIHIEIDDFNYREENSPNLMRGRLNGNVVVYEVAEIDQIRIAEHKFSHELNSVYPVSHPINREQMSEKVFLKKYLDRINREISMMFYSHRSSETVY